MASILGPFTNAEALTLKLKGGEGGWTPRVAWLRAREGDSPLVDAAAIEGAEDMEYHPSALDVGRYLIVHVTPIRNSDGHEGTPFIVRAPRPVAIDPSMASLIEKLQTRGKAEFRVYAYVKSGTSKSKSKSKMKRRSREELLGGKVEGEEVVVTLTREEVVVERVPHDKKARKAARKSARRAAKKARKKAGKKAALEANRVSRVKYNTSMVVDFHPSDDTRFALTLVPGKHLPFVAKNRYQRDLFCFTLAQMLRPFVFGTHNDHQSGARRSRGRTAVRALVGADGTDSDSEMSNGSAEGHRFPYLWDTSTGGSYSGEEYSDSVPSSFLSYEYYSSS